MVKLLKFASRLFGREYMTAAERRLNQLCAERD